MLCQSEVCLSIGTLIKMPAVDLAAYLRELIVHDIDCSDDFKKKNKNEAAAAKR